jgi:hypothetical protein
MQDMAFFIIDDAMPFESLCDRWQQLTGRENHWPGYIIKKHNLVGPIGNKS